MLNITDLSVQFSSATQSCLTLCEAMNRSTPGLPVHHQLPGFTQTHAHWVGDVIQPSHPLSSPSPPATNPSQHQGLFQWVSSLHKLPKYWSFSFSIIPSSEHPGLISFRMDWLDLLAVIRGMQIKPTVGESPHIYSIGFQKYIKQEILVRMWRKQNPLCTVGGNVNWYELNGKIWSFQKKIKNRTTITLNISTSCYLYEEIKNTNMKRYMYLCVRCNTIYMTQGMEAT